MRNIVIVISALVDAFLIDTILSSVMRRKKKMRVIIAAALVFVACIIMLSFVVQNGAIKLLLGMAAAFVISFVVYDASLVARMMACAIFYCIYLNGDYFAHGLISLVDHWWILNENLFFLGALASYTYLVSFIFIYKRVPIRLREVDQRSRLLVMSAAICCALIMAVLVGYIERALSIVVIPFYIYLACALFFLAFNILLIAFSNRIASLQNENRMRLIYQSQLNHFEHYHETIENIYNQMRGIYHDLPMHLSAIAGLEAEGKLADVDAYKKNVLDMVPVGARYSRTGSMAVDIIFQSYLTKAEEHGINIRFDISIQMIHIPNADLSVVLGNALENAIEACLKCKKTQTTSINITFKQNGDYLYLEVSNPIEWEVDLSYELPETTKVDRQFHGFGLLNIKRIVEKYNGHIKCSINNDTFKLICILYNGLGKIS